MEANPGVVSFVVQIMPALNAVYLGGVATFTCDVSSVPEPYTIHNYTWDAPEPVVRDVRYRFEDNRRILKILDVSYADDNSYVSCNAFLNNGLKGRQTHGTISVLAPGEGTTKKATTTLTTTAKVSTAAIGGTSKIPATNAVNPLPTDRVTSKIPIPTPTPTPTNKLPVATSKTLIPIAVTNKDSTYAYTEGFRNFTEGTEFNVSVPNAKSPGAGNKGELLPPISAGGAVIAVLGFIIVGIILFVVIRYLRKENEKTVKGINRNKRGGSSARVLLYNRRTDDVTTYDKPPQGKQNNGDHVDSDSNSSPGRDRIRYTPKNNNGSTKHLKSQKQSVTSTTSYEDMKSPTSVGSNSFGTAYEQMARSSNQKENHAYRTASNYSIISSSSYDNLSPASLHNEDELRHSGGSGEDSFKNGHISLEGELGDVPEYSKVRKPDRNANHTAVRAANKDYDYAMVNDIRSSTPITAV